MTHVTCRLPAKNRDQLRNPTLVNRVWATFTFLAVCFFLVVKGILIIIIIIGYQATIYFISELGRKISEYSDDPFDSRYFTQRVSVLIQRYNV